MYREGTLRMLLPIRRHMCFVPSLEVEISVDTPFFLITAVDVIDLRDFYLCMTRLPRHGTLTIASSHRVFHLAFVHRHAW